MIEFNLKAKKENPEAKYLQLSEDKLKALLEALHKYEYKFAQTYYTANWGHKTD